MLIRKLLLAAFAASVLACVGCSCCRARTNYCPAPCPCGPAAVPAAPAPVAAGFAPSCPSCAGY